MSAAGKRAIFAACARNCATHLPAVLRNMERLSSLFADCAFVFVENDSTDATRAILEQWGARRRHFHLFKLDGLAARIPQRTVRLEVARNACTAFIRITPELIGFDYLVVMDCDEVTEREIALPRVTRALEFLELEEAHAGVFANNIGPYFDMWALRQNPLCPGDVWEEVVDYSLSHDVPDAVAFHETFEKKMLSFDPSRDPIEVDSAFNGFGIYKMGFVRENRNPYLGYKTKAIVRAGQSGVVRLQTCEHVHHNLGIRSAGGRLFILPYLTLFEGVSGKLPLPVNAWRSLVF
jgi:hypothetical protein